MQFDDDEDRCVVCGVDPTKTRQGLTKRNTQRGIPTAVDECSPRRASREASWLQNGARRGDRFKTARAE